MTIIEAPVRQQTIQIEENENQKIIGEMIEMVKNDKWCRDTVKGPGGRACTIGLIECVMDSDYLDVVIAILDHTIPAGALHGRRGEVGERVNGGTSRGRGVDYD